MNDPASDNPVGKKRRRARPLTVGWKEYLSFPEWGARRVKVKIDTGARTSALGVVGYELRQVDGANLIAELRLALNRGYPDQLTTVHVPVLRMVTVRNSSGVEEQRPLIEAAIKLGPVRKRILLSVANRSVMRFPMILGRKALEGDFVVDVSAKYLLTARRRRRQ